MSLLYLEIDAIWFRDSQVSRSQNRLWSALQILKETRLKFQVKNVALVKIEDLKVSIDFSTALVRGWSYCHNTIGSDLYSDSRMNRRRVRDYCRFSWLQYVSTNKSTREECKVEREGRLVVLEAERMRDENAEAMYPGNRRYR